MWRTNEMFVSTDGFACRRAGNLTPGTFSLTPSSNPAAVPGFCGKATIWCKRDEYKYHCCSSAAMFPIHSSLFSPLQELLWAVMRCCSVPRRYHLPHYYFKSSDNSTVSDVILMHMEGVPVTWYPGFGGVGDPHTLNKMSDHKPNEANECLEQLRPGVRWTYCRL